MDLQEWRKNLKIGDSIQVITNPKADDLVETKRRGQSGIIIDNRSRHSVAVLWTDRTTDSVVWRESLIPVPVPEKTEPKFYYLQVEYQEGYKRNTICIADCKEDVIGLAKTNPYIVNILVNDASIEQVSEWIVREIPIDKITKKTVTKTEYMVS